MLTIHLPTDDYEGLAAFGAVLDTLPPPGDSVLSELWNGTSLLYQGGMPSSQPLLHMQEDANGDGIADYWLTYFLLEGPVTGPAVDMDTVIAGDHLARLESVDPDDPSSGSPDGHVLAAGFDADGDGHDDILVGTGAIESQAFIHYGPFEGIVPSGRLGHSPDASAITRDGCVHTSQGTHVIPDLSGPGRPGIFLGGSDPAHECNPDRGTFPLDLPRGSSVSEPVWQGNMGGPTVMPVGDVTGDGLDDLATWRLEGSATQRAHPAPDGRVIASPLTGTFDFADPIEQEVWFGTVTHPVGDLNGDGVDDIGGWWHEAEESVVLLSPHPPGPIDMSRGVQVRGFPLEYNGDSNSLTVGDFDGDGLDELVYVPADLQLYEAPYVVVYTGAQLTEAWAELHGL